MPLDKSGSKASVGNNIRTELAAGKPRRQAIAIALDVARRAKRATAGSLSEADWLQRTAAHTLTNRNNAPKMPAVAAPKPLAIKGNMVSVTPVGQAISATPKVGNVKPQFPKLPGPPPTSIKVPKLTMRKGGTVSKGALVGHTRGRDDKLKADVEDGAYVLPADLPSSSALGQGNSLAGLAMLQNMFPDSKQPTKLSKGGTTKNEGTVPCMLSDGEFVIGRADCLKLGGGDLAKAHRILDHLVLRLRHHNVETLKRLPGPAHD